MSDQQPTSRREEGTVPPERYFIKCCTVDQMELHSSHSLVLSRGFCLRYRKGIGRENLHRIVVETVRDKGSLLNDLVRV